MQTRDTRIISAVQPHWPVCREECNLNLVKSAGLREYNPIGVGHAPMAKCNSETKRTISLIQVLVWFVDVTFPLP